jgi:hypothetical protein
LVCFVLPVISVGSLISASPVATVASVATGLALAVCCFGAGSWALSVNHHIANEESAISRIAVKLDQWLEESSRQSPLTAAEDPVTTLWASVQAALLGPRPEHAVHLLLPGNPAIHTTFSPELQAAVRTRDVIAAEAAEAETTYVAAQAREQQLSASLAELETETRQAELQLSQARLRFRDSRSALEVGWQNARVHAEQAFHLANTALTAERFSRIRIRKSVA